MDEEAAIAQLVDTLFDEVFAAWVADFIDLMLRPFG